jgi:sulfotransferase family protein
MAALRARAARWKRGGSQPSPYASGRAHPAIAPGHGSDPGGAWLVPILVDHVGRDGSTLLMRLLASSPQIAVEGPYPFERKYFAYLWRWSRILDRRDWPADSWGPRDLTSLAQEVEQPLVGPPPWLPRSLSDAPGRSLSQRCFELMWTEFSQRAAAVTGVEHDRPSAEVRYYAEKQLATWKLDMDALPEVRRVVLLRDPRDAYVSASSFSERRGSVAFYGVERGDEAEQLLRFAAAQRQRLRWIASLTESSALQVVRYEELVLDLDRVAPRLAEWLGVDLDPAAAAADRRIRRLHVTAETPQRSIGRWKEELAPDAVAVFRRELGAELQAVGLDT